MDIRLFFKSRWSRLRLQQQIAITSISLVLFALLITTGLTVYWFNTVLTEYISTLEASNVAQLGNDLSDSFEEMEIIANLYAGDERIKDLVFKDAGEGIQRLNRLQLFDTISSVFLLLHEGMNHLVTVVGPEEKLFYSYQTVNPNISDVYRKIRKSRAYTEINEKRSPQVWSLPHVPFEPVIIADYPMVVSFSQMIFRVDNFSQVGMVTVSVPINLLTKNISSKRGEEFYLIRPGSQPYLLKGNGYLTRQVVETVSEFRKDESMYRLVSGNKRFFIFLEKLHPADWYVLKLTPTAMLNTRLSRLILSIALMAILMTALIVILSFLITRNITNPLFHLVEVMDNFNPEHPQEVTEFGNTFEVSHLGHAYNRMQEYLNLLLAKVKQKEIDKREAELAMLRSQLNPHFLFNTMNSIKWLATLQGAEKTAYMVASLGRLLEASMGKGPELIPLKEEIELSRCFIELMNFRYNNGINLHLDVAKGSEEALVPKLILQPLIENSIKHGFSESHGYGDITISAKYTGKGIALAVVDNGKGFKEPSNTEDIEISDSIGLQNVKKRIYAHYEESLIIHSEIGKGTRITFLIPENSRGER